MTKRWHILAVVLLVSVLLVTPVSAADIFTEVIDGINGIYNSLLNLGLYLWSQWYIPFAALLYPFVLLVNLLYTDLNTLYTPVAAFLNSILSLPNTALDIVNNWTPAHDSSITSAAISNIAGSTVANAWNTYKHAESTAYALLSIAVILMSITANILLRAARWLIWLYKKIPIVGGH